MPSIRIAGQLITNSVMPYTQAPTNSHPEKNYYQINIEVGCEQAGFRKHSGTREAIFCLKVITAKYLEMGKELYACFIDYSKAFDTVSHEQLISSLSGIEVDDNDIAVIAHLY